MNDFFFQSNFLKFSFKRVEFQIFKIEIPMLLRVFEIHQHVPKIMIRNTFE